MKAQNIGQIEQGLATHKRMFLQSDEMIQEEPKEFRHVPSNYFDIKDTKQIEELTNIIKTNSKNKKTSFQLQGLQSKSEAEEIVPEHTQIEQNFSNKMNCLFTALDGCKKQIDNERSQQIQEQKYLYYTLDDVEYQDKEVVSEAFAFLRQLDKIEKLKKKREQQLNQDEELIEEEFDILTFKPTYQQSQKKTQLQESQIKTEEQKLKTKFKNLTIEDEEEEEYENEEQKEEDEDMN